MDPAPRDGATFIPYGPWATLGLTAAVFLGADLLAEGLLRLFGGSAQQPGTTALNPDYLLAAMIVGGIIGTAVLVQLVQRRAPGRLNDYLALHWVDGATAWRWLAMISAFLVITMVGDALARTAFQIPVPPNPLDGAGIGPVFLLAVCVVAPIFEELLFRGFLMEGLAPTRLGQSGALTLSTLLWTLLHGQYDLIGMLIVFGCGMILGLARLNTGSLLLAIAMHATFNSLSILLSVV